MNMDRAETIDYLIRRFDRWGTENITVWRDDETSRWLDMAILEDLVRDGLVGSSVPRNHDPLNQTVYFTNRAHIDKLRREANKRVKTNPETWRRQLRSILDLDDAQAVLEGILMGYDRWVGDFEVHTYFQEDEGYAYDVVDRFLAHPTDKGMARAIEQAQLLVDVMEGETVKLYSIDDLEKWQGEVNPRTGNERLVQIVSHLSDYADYVEGQYGYRLDGESQRALLTLLRWSNGKEALHNRDVLSHMTTLFDDFLSLQPSKSLRTNAKRLRLRAKHLRRGG